ncbi:MAG: hypothetical protein ABIH65_03970 [Nanoarchaeota archaeon]
MRRRNKKTLGWVLLIGGILLSIYNYSQSGMYFLFGGLSGFGSDALSQFSFIMAIEGWFFSLFTFIGLISIALFLIGLFTIKNSRRY